jgi:general secretion pathway protein D
MCLFSLRVRVRVRVWSFRRPARKAALFLFASVMLAACTVPPPLGANEPPDAVDRIRAVDLQPRSPQSSATADTGSAGNRPQLYYGSSGGLALARARPLATASI